MSTIKVEVTHISDVRPHGNADTLELATVGGWQMCVKKGAYKNGDPVVYIEAGTTLPREVADKLGVTNYLSERTDIDGNKVLVVHHVKLRGEPSFGLVLSLEPGMQAGQDVAAFYGAAKYNPPLKVSQGDSIGGHALFPAYTEIENMRSYPDVIADSEEVVVTEKIHGTNCRVGFVAEMNDGQRVYTAMAGSKGLRRKQPASDAEMRSNLYWFPTTLPGVQALLREISESGARQAVLYGETYGPGVQTYHYGVKSIAFRAFDLMIDMRYLNYDEFLARCKKHGIETVPLIFRGPYALSKIKELSEGKSLVGGAQCREGVVAKPTVERTDARIGRVILKYISDTYLFGKAAEQDTTDM
ncbi:MAG TPA: RNA ligase (ATP) [Planctomycetota bacterium]|nr:RNA ligase (ATP) [Planctomycetota bacterium]